jgi:predicted Rdx family selenoprotein
MSDVYTVKEKMHKMRAKLYPSYLPGTEGKYIARTSNEATVSIEDICASMKNRGGFDGSYEEAVKTLNHFFKEMMYQLADGFSVNLDYFTVHPNIGGTFKSTSEAHNHKDHPIDFRFQAMAKLRALVKDIDVEIEGIADVQAYIDEFNDLEEQLINSVFLPSQVFTLHGHKIKIEGPQPPNGVFFQPINDPSQMIPALNILENTPSKILGLTPDVGPVNTKVKIIIVTQHSGGNTLLKTPRTITGPFTLEEH